jgi:hypothetical protein
VKVLEKFLDFLFETPDKKLERKLKNEERQIEKENGDIRALETRMEADLVLKEEVKKIAEYYGIEKYKTSVVRSESVEGKGKPIINIHFEDMEIMRSVLINQSPDEIRWNAGGRWDEGSAEFLTFATTNEEIQIEWYGYTSCGWGGLFSKVQDSGYWTNEMYGYKNVPSWSGADRGKYIKEKSIS